MRHYKYDFYDSNGKYLHSIHEKLPSEPGRWKGSKNLSKKEGVKTRDYKKPTRGGINEKVVKSFAYFPDGSKVKISLVEKPRKNKNKK